MISRTSCPRARSRRLLECGRAIDCRPTSSRLCTEYSEIGHEQNIECCPRGRDAGNIEIMSVYCIPYRRPDRTPMPRARQTSPIAPPRCAPPAASSDFPTTETPPLDDVVYPLQQGIEMSSSAIKLSVQEANAAVPAAIRHYPRRGHALVYANSAFCRLAGIANGDAPAEQSPPCSRGLKEELSALADRAVRDGVERIG